MARDWRRLVIAAAAATAVATVCTLSAEAQAPAKKAKAAESQQAADQDAAATAPAKKKKQDPVEAQRAVDAALRLLEAGKADQAAQALSGTLAGGNLPPAIMAKALLYRGIAYRQQKKPAQAIADLTSALWLKGGLGESDRKDALRQRASAYQEAGLTETGEAIAPAAPPAAAHAPAPATRTASASKTWGTETTWAPTAPADAQSAPAPAPAPAQQTSGWNFFGNLFGGSSTSPAAAPAAPAPAAAATASIETSEPTAARRQAGDRPTSTSAWAHNTEVRGGTSAVVRGALPAKPEGKFRVQVGIVRTQGEAEALAAKVKREHGPVLDSRATEIDQAVVGNMGTFYRVRVGPFATQQETQGLCAKLRGSGLDCLVVTQ